LSALDEKIAEWKVDDTRNIRGGSTGYELPPVNETIQLNSTQVRTFLVEGSRFMQGKEPTHKLVLQVERYWWGLGVDLYAPDDYADQAIQFLEEVWERARQLKFLKGEAFSLSGEFLPRGEQSWDDLFLTDKNETAIKRVVALLKEKGAELDNRGVILMGPPGTGKTLGGRIIMNTAPATFIWVSARDFGRFGAFGGFAHAFDVARENSPSVIFFEDVDEWISQYEVDLLKSEMDGIGQSTGIVTMLTTNHPEELPKAIIDRPGRFHDVLRFDLPATETRRKMIAKWLPDVTDETILNQVLEGTKGFSGAHVRELCRFAEILRSEDSSITVNDAIVKALMKIEEQRALIGDTQMRYRRSIGDLVQRARKVIATKTIGRKDAELLMGKTVEAKAEEDKKEDMVKPDADGKCPEGMTLGDDGYCHWPMLSQEEAEEKQEGFQIQTLIFPKAMWNSEAECAKWCSDHNYKVEVDETGDSWRYRQEEPSKFERLRTICINPGTDSAMDECKVKAVGGPMKSAPIVELEEVLEESVTVHESVDSALATLEKFKSVTLTQRGNFFVIRDDTAESLGKEKPDGVQPLGEGGRSWAIVAESGGTNIAWSLGHVERSRAIDFALNMIERRKDIGLNLILARSVGYIVDEGVRRLLWRETNQLSWSPDEQAVPESEDSETKTVSEVLTVVKDIFKGPEFHAAVARAIGRAP
jgi:hypothetical protein